MVNSLNPFNIIEQGMLLQIYSESEITIKDSSFNTYYPFERSNNLHLFKMDIPGEYCIYANEVMWGGKNFIVIPKEVKPINSYNKLLFDYRYA